jgi:hypothetical protein
MADPGVEVTGAPLADIVAEAERVLDAAEAQGVVLRLIGGLAVHVHARPLPAPLARAYGDIDTATVKGQNRAVSDLLSGLGYEPARQFNALHGASRMLFHDRPNDRKLDVFVDGFELNHSIPITARIDAEQRTIPLAELLLTKLQVVEFTDKDMRDTLALLVGHDVGPGDAETINGDVVAALTAEDWGLWRTTQINLERMRDGLDAIGLDEQDRERALGRIDSLWRRIEAEPKSRRWRMRARVGERKRWYQVPDEV